MVPYAVGVVVMVGLCARFFGKVSLWAFSLATVALTAILVLLGV